MLLVPVRSSNDLGQVKWGNIYHETGELWTPRRKLYGRILYRKNALDQPYKCVIHLLGDCLYAPKVADFWTWTMNCMFKQKHNYVTFFLLFDSENFVININNEKSQEVCFVIIVYNHYIKILIVFYKILELIVHKRNRSASCPRFYIVLLLRVCIRN